MVKDEGQGRENAEIIICRNSTADSPICFTLLKPKSSWKFLSQTAFWRLKGQNVTFWYSIETA